MEKNKERSESGPINVVADAAVVIVIEKLRKLRLIEEVCLALKRQIEGLIFKLGLVYGFLESGCRKDSHPEWTYRLLRALYEAEDSIDIFMCKIVQREQERLRIVPDVLMTLIWKCSLYQRMNNFTGKVDELIEDQHLHHPDTKSSARSSEVSQCQYYERWRSVNADREDPEDIGTYRNDAYEKVMWWLLNDNTIDLCSTAIYGHEGTGKTYLSGRVFNRPQIRNRFKSRAWVHVSSGLTLKDIRYEVLKQVKAPGRVLKNSEHMDEDEVQQALFQELGDKPYLIVLDDINDIDTWYKFIRYLPEWYKGSRVLVTTRDDYLARLVDYNSVNLKTLGEGDSSRMLEKRVNPVEPSPQEKRQIFQASKGLPLAVALLGGLLVDAKHKKGEFEIERESLSEILTRSYNNLPREEKPCFLYLIQFPKATPIPVRRIIQLWLGEGLLTDLGMSSPEDEGVKYLEDLIMRNLVEVVSWEPDGTPGTCQVVTSMYDMFRPQAVELGLLHIHNQKEKDSEPSQVEPVQFKGQQFKVRWLAEYSNIKSFSQSDTHHIQHMRSFVSFYARKGTLTKDLGTFLRTVTSYNNFRLLRVLDLEGVYKPYLHDTIGRLVLLEYLGLRSTVLDTLPDCVGDLPKLVTLDIKKTIITNLPDSIWKSRCLRHLYLNGFHVSQSILRRSSRFLSNLRTLSGIYVANINESLVSDLVASVTKLTKLKIYYQSTDNTESITQWISKLTNLHSLKLGIIKKDSASSAQLPNLTYLPEHHHLFNLYLLGNLPKLDANQLPSCLRVLTLSMSELSDDPMPSLGKLLHLRTLRLLANSYTGAKMSCLTQGFTSLRVLKVWNLTKLQELTVGKGCMASLKELEIRDYAALKFERVIGLEHLISLGELILTKMAKAFVTDARKRKVELPKDCCIFESGTIEPQDTRHQEQTKEGKIEVFQKEEIEGGKRDNRAIALPQGSGQPKEEGVDSGEQHSVATKMKPETVPHNEYLPPTQNQQKIRDIEEEPLPGLMPATLMNGDHTGPPPMVHPATRTGPGGGSPFAM